MLKQQLWEPDTHAGVKLYSEWDYPDAPEGGWPDPDNIPPATFVRCFSAVVDSVEHPDPDGVYATVLAENQLKNATLGFIEDALPVAYKKQVLDSDGDPTGEFVVKDKHKPLWDFGAIDGLITFTVPGLDEETRAAIALLLPDGVTLG